MKPSRVFIVCVILSTFVFFAFHRPTRSAYRAVQEEKGNVGFKWGFGAEIGPEKKFVPITRDTSLKTGDELKMVVNLTRDCFVYVVYQNSKGDISLIFPYEFKQFMTDYKVGKNYYIPKARPWFILDESKGRETFYLLASADRLLQLESFVSLYNEADAAKKTSLAQQILTEIRDVRKRYRTFTTLAEKPIAIGGNVRGTAKGSESARRPDVATIATEISATNFYGKTFTIDHQ